MFSNFLMAAISQQISIMTVPMGGAPTTMN